MFIDIDKLGLRKSLISALWKDHLAKRQEQKGRPKPSRETERDMHAAFVEAYVLGYQDGLNDGERIHSPSRRPPGIKSLLDPNVIEFPRPPTN